MEDSLSESEGTIESRGGFHPVLFYSLSISIAWLAWSPLLLSKYRGVDLLLPFPIVLFVCQTIGAFAPLLSLFGIQTIKQQHDLVRSVFRNLRFKGLPVLWFLLPALIPLAIAVASSLVYGLFVPDQPIEILRTEPLDDLGWALVLVLPFAFVMGLIGSPLGEEPGWRGYILDRFAEGGRGFLGSGIVAAMWWIWHVPLFFVLDAPVSGYSFLEMTGHSLLIDSFFLLSGRNLLVAMLYHQGVSTAFMFFAAKTQTVPGLIALLGISLGARWLAGRQNRHAR